MVCGFPLPRGMTGSDTGMTDLAPPLWIADQVRNDGPGWLGALRFAELPMNGWVKSRMTGTRPRLWIAGQVQNDGRPCLPCGFCLKASMAVAYASIIWMQTGPGIEIMCPVCVSLPV